MDVEVLTDLQQVTTTVNNAVVVHLLEPSAEFSHNTGLEPDEDEEWHEATMA